MLVCCNGASCLSTRCAHDACKTCHVEHDADNNLHTVLQLFPFLGGLRAKLPRDERETSYQTDLTGSTTIILATAVGSELLFKQMNNWIFEPTQSATWWIESFESLICFLNAFFECRHVGLNIWAFESFNLRLYSIFNKTMVLFKKRPQCWKMRWCIQKGGLAWYLFVFRIKPLLFEHVLKNK